MADKKKFTEPEIKVIELEQTDLICTSGETEAYNNGNTTGWY